MLRSKIITSSPQGHHHHQGVIKVLLFRYATQLGANQLSDEAVATMTERCDADTYVTTGFFVCFHGNLIVRRKHAVKKLSLS